MTRIGYDTAVAAVTPRATSPTGSPRDETGGAGGDRFADLLAVCGVGIGPSSQTAREVPATSQARPADIEEPGLVSSTTTPGEEVAVALMMTSVLGWTVPPIDQAGSPNAAHAPTTALEHEPSGTPRAGVLADPAPSPQPGGTPTVDLADSAAPCSTRQDALAAAEVVTLEVGDGPAPGAPDELATPHDPASTNGPRTTAVAPHDPASTVATRPPAAVPVRRAGLPSTDAPEAPASPVPVGAPRTAVATERPIAPARLPEVLLAATRTSAEAERPVRLSLRLDPPHLGEIRVELLARNGTVTVRVEPVHEAAAPLLSQQRQAVSDVLARSGFTMTSFDVGPGTPQRERAAPTKRTVRVAEATATGEAPEPKPTDEAGRLGLRI